MTGLAVGWADDDRLVRAAWSRIAEPEDLVAGWVRHRLGPVTAMQHVLAGTPLPVEVAEGEVANRAVARRRLDDGLERWRVRLPRTDPRRDVAVVERLGGRLLVPGDDEWPPQLDDLGGRTPAALWVLGPAHLANVVQRSVAIVGARACTSYGEHVAGELAGGAADHGLTVVSGGAFGIDAAAHRGALAAGGATVVVLACGVDRDYPRAHDQLFARIRQTGLAVSEAAPGSTVTRWRFLQRNRLIAAMTGGTVVVEAAWRSGAIRTATFAAGLDRPLGAVPGPVTSSMSAGCHRVLRDLSATCVTDTAELVELVRPIGESYPGGAPVPVFPHDQLDELDLRVYESLPLRTGRPVTSLSQVAGLPERQVVAALGRLSLAGLAELVAASDGERLWKRGVVAQPERLSPAR